MKRLLLVAALLGVLLFAGPSFAAIELGNFSFTNVLIVVNYTDAVQMELSALSSIDSNELYDLDMTFPNQGVASDSFIFRPIHPGGSTRKPLLPGRYGITLSVSDVITNVVVTDYREFVILGLDIELTKPVHGVATTAPFEMEWTTKFDGNNVLAECRWHTTTQTVWQAMFATEEGFTPSSTHHPDCDPITGTLCSGASDNEIHYRGDIFVLCRESSGRETPAIFYIDYDNSPPVLDITVIPTIVNDENNKWAVIRVLTDDETTCMVDGYDFPGEDPTDTSSYSTFHEVKFFYDTITDNSEHRFPYDIDCINKAGLSASGSALVIVDLDYSSNIDIKNPPQDVDYDEYTLVADPLFVTDNCTVNGDNMTAYRSDYERDFAPPEVREGDNPYDVHCEGPTEQASRLYVVTVELDGECNSDSDCEDEQMCIDGVCEDPSLDTCFDDDDCPQGEICEDDVCVFPDNGCSTPFDCPDITWACIDGACFPPSGDECSSNFDCTSPETCENGSCGYVPPPGSGANCILAADCPNSGEQCVNGACVLPQPPKTACVSDFDCPDLDDECTNGICVSPGGGGDACVLSTDCPNFNEICVNGVCIPRNDPPPPPPPPCEGDDCVVGGDEPTDWWAIILIILGLLIMGGCGYFLWYENDQKQQERSRKAQQQVNMQQQARPNPQQAAMIEKALEERKKAVSAMQRQKAAEKAQKKEGRREKFDAFGEGKPAKKVVKKAPKKPVKKAAKQKEDNAFDELEKLGK